jgi:hypothetical protein
MVVCRPIVGDAERSAHPAEGELTVDLGAVTAKAAGSSVTADLRAAADEFTRAAAVEKENSIGQAVIHFDAALVQLLGDVAAARFDADKSWFEGRGALQEAAWVADQQVRSGSHSSIFHLNVRGAAELICTPSGSDAACRELSASCQMRKRLFSLMAERACSAGPTGDAARARDLYATLLPMKARSCLTDCTGRRRMRLGPGTSCDCLPLLRGEGGVGDFGDLVHLPHSTTSRTRPILAPPSAQGTLEPHTVLSPSPASPLTKS